jgi:UDP-N-acetylmuramoylalanine--D-glutamate ligase
MQDNEYLGMKVLIMGLGLNNGGLSSALYLAQRGAEIVVTDLRDEKTLAPSIEKLEAGLNRPGFDNSSNVNKCGSNNRAIVRYVLGRHEIEDFRAADMVIKNPGVRPDSPYLLEAKRIETDISLFLAASSCRLTAVTGSEGKSSIASALHWVLKQWAEQQDGQQPQNPVAGKRNVFLGGNITLSPLSFLDELNDGDDVVLELSSFQLGDLRGRINAITGKALLKPRAAVISAIMPDHLNRYGTMEVYVADKRVIYQGQEREDVLVTQNDSWGQSFRSESRARSLIYSDEPLPDGLPGGWIDEASGSGLVRLCGSGNSGPGNNASDANVLNEIVEAVPTKLLVPGRHQKKNMLAAALALLDLGLDAGFIMNSLGSFPGIEHRLEFFHESRGIKFYNDSAATIPEAAALAIRAFDRVPVLVCGGPDKELDFSPMVEAWAEAERNARNDVHNGLRAKVPILLEGSGSIKIVSLLDKLGLGYSIFDTLDKAVQAALEVAQVGDAVILSPGCTSFGMFLNEFDRGNKWKETVRRLA